MTAKTTPILRIIPLALAGLLLAAPEAMAQRASHCIAIARAAPGLEYIQPASFGPALEDYTVRIRYLTHSAFLIRTPGGFSAVTDYPGYIGPADFVPDVVTMNHAHSSHYTTNPDERIPHVLRGWSETYGEPARHAVEVDDVLIRNVTTDIRQGAGREAHGNSIFIFEAEGLCIGHLGHLHHEPNDDQYAAMGRLDVLMVPVDGGMTLDTPSMVRVVERLKSSVVLPMHWFSGASLNWFLDELSGTFEIDLRDDSHIDLSLTSLPARPTITVLRPRLLSEVE